MPSRTAFARGRALTAALIAAACASNDAPPGSGSAPSAATPASTAAAASSTPAGPSAPRADPLVEAADRGRTLGRESATVWMLIVSDFQCPFCKEWHDQTWGAIRREYVETGKIRVAYLNYPLGQHRHALPAAIAAMCASAQGRFWEVADRIFDTQNAWQNLSDARAFFDSLATRVVPDAAAQRACVDGKRVGALIEADVVRSQRAGAESTPTFFIGSRMIAGAQPVAVFRRAVEEELSRGNR